MPSRDDSLADELDVPLFPLPRVVLFPGMILPLLVFEPRYRALVADALAGDRLVAVPRLAPGHDTEYWGSPPVCSTFGVGRIIDDVRLPDGRYRIVVSGLGRVHLLHEVQTEPYRVARVKSQRERDTGSSAAVLALRASLLGQADKLTRTLGDEAARLMQLVREAPPLRCVDLIAANLVADDAVRQRVLEADSVQSRLELLVGHLHGVSLELDAEEPRGVLN
jgi:uncharacterized protein